jgi:tRNA threonylcarbamoyladenosine biosynthesis protein TsaB
MTILAIDTSTTACTIALKHAGKIFSYHQDLPRKQSEQLLVQVDAVLKQANIGLDAVDLFACGVGPGSFMGCRLAVGVIQGLAFATRRPVVGVSTLQVLAQTAYEELQFESVFSAWDARMGKVYMGLYQLDTAGLMRPLQPDAMFDPAELAVIDQGRWSAVGNAWQVYKDEINQPLLSSFCGCNTTLFPQARSMFQLVESISEDDYLQPHQLAPVYLRQPVS